MTGSSAEIIKEKLDIIDVVKGYVQLQPAGRNMKGLCPFHKEKTPSFIVSPDRQSWHCFGCSIGGDVFSFVMRYENLEFAEALKILAERAGVQLQRVSPTEYRYAGLLYDINEQAAVFFQRQLQQANTTQEYLASRKLSPETAQLFQVGWAPNEQEGLSLFLLHAGFSPEDVIRAGLALKNERGLQFDRFRGRIMFPIRNHVGKVVGFTGRILPQLDNGTSGKYVNTPETPIFNKSRILYGLNITKEAIRQKSQAFLVEGQMDVLMSYQAGVKNVVASSGTAFTPEHLRSLRRLADEIIVSFDNDEAGWAAGERAVDLAQTNDFNVRVTVLRDFKDPAEAAAANPSYLQDAVSGAQPAMQVFFERYLPGATDYSAPQGLKALRTVLGKVQHLSSAVQKGIWLELLSRHCGISEAALREEISIIKTETPRAVEEPAEGAVQPKLSRWQRLAQQYLSGAAALGKLSEVRVDYLPPEYRPLLPLLVAGEKRSSDSRLDEMLGAVLLQVRPVTENEFEELSIHLTHEYIMQSRKRLAIRIKKAEDGKNDEELRTALHDLTQLSELEEKMVI